MKKLTVRKEDVSKASHRLTGKEISIAHSHLVLIPSTKESAIFAKRMTDCSITLWHPALALPEIERIFEFYDPTIIINARPVEGEPCVYMEETKLGEKPVIKMEADRDDMKNESCFQVIALKEQLSANVLLGIVDNEVRPSDRLHVECELAESGEYYQTKLDENGNVEVSRCSGRPKLPPGVSVHGFDSVEDLIDGLEDLIKKQKIV